MGGQGFWVATASQLAEHGLIEKAEPRSADGPERWCQPASDGVSVREEDFRDAPEKAAAHVAAHRLFFEQRADMVRREQSAADGG